LVAGLFLAAAGLAALEGPEVVVVADAVTGRVLMEKNGGVPAIPASLTKLMTLYLVLSDVEAGRYGVDDLVLVPPEGAAAAMRAGSSTLGLQAGDRISIETLIRATAVVSAGDAAWCLALHSAGTMDAFVDRMNQMAIQLGMVGTHFVDPDGWSDLNRSTGRDLMRLARAYLRDHPEAPGRYHVLRRMTYRTNDDPGRYPNELNTNLLLGRVDGVDGLKTGRTPQAGFHFLATARRDDTRILALVLGIRSDDFGAGLRSRADEARALLEWAFDGYATWFPGRIPDIRIPVRHGAVLAVDAAGGAMIDGRTLPRDDIDEVVRIVDVVPVLEAPVRQGQRVGAIRWYLHGRTIMEIPMVSAEAVDRRWRLKDAFALTSSRLGVCTGGGTAADRTR